MLMEKQSIRKESKNLIGAATAIAVLASPLQASARDLTGKYANSPYKAYMEALISKKGVSCCTDADGDKAAYYELRSDGYYVKLDGTMVKVPDETMVTSSNPVGSALIWTYKDEDGKTQIRCFLPPSLATLPDKMTRTGER